MTPSAMLQRKWAACLLILPCLVFVAIRVSEKHQRQRDDDVVTPVDLLTPTPVTSGCPTSESSRTTVPLSATSSPDKTVFVITPTYRRPTQAPDMTRFAQTLKLASLMYGSIFWIVVEDSNTTSDTVAEILNRTALPHAHLLGPRPVTHLDKRSGRGVSNRLRGLTWLREQYSNTPTQGVIYFADDDNSYDVRIFEEMKKTTMVSVWPVGLIGKHGIASPIVYEGHVIGFHDEWLGRRKFALDMAGFAVDLQFFLSRPKATMPYKVGYEEDIFVRTLGIKIHDLEPIAKNCTEVLVWHTKTNDAVFPKAGNIDKGNSASIRNTPVNSTNLPILYSNILKPIG